MARTIKQILLQVCELELAEDEIDDREMLINGDLGLDSYNVLLLVARLEECFHIRVPDEDITPEVLDCVGALVEYVLRRQEG